MLFYLLLFDFTSVFHSFSNNYLNMQKSTKKYNNNNSNNFNLEMTGTNQNYSFTSNSVPLHYSQTTPYLNNQDPLGKNFDSKNSSYNNSIPENIYPYSDMSTQPQFETGMFPNSYHSIPSSQPQSLQVASPAINGMLTPFDAVYGATLLPSHLLMGSPFVTSPHVQTPQQFPQSTFNRNKSSNGYSIYSNFNPNDNINNNKASRRYFKKKNHNDNILNENVQSTSEYIDKIESLFKQPFNISYKILPKGDDAYRTRSLLLENIDSSINIHDFITKYVKSSEIESIYSFQKGSGQNILLSFMSTQICLNFYNNVLQRLKEFKLGLKSENMNLNFILLKYLKDTSDEDSLYTDKEITDISMFKFDLMVEDATRSILIELKDTYDNDKIVSLLKDLKLIKDNDMNKRYILESVLLFNTSKSNKIFNKNYVILTFLNIYMATEIFNYLNYKSDKLNIGKWFFVNIASPLVGNKNLSSTDLESSSNISRINSVNSFHNSDIPKSSSVNLFSSQNSLNSNPSVSDITALLKRIELEDNFLTINADAYPEPFIENFKEHQPNITKIYSQTSHQRRSNSILSTPIPLDMTFHDGTVFSPIHTNGFTPNHNILVPQTPIGISTPTFYMKQPPFRYSNNLPQPITDSLEDQLNTSAKVATAMGSDITNRTIYIGNINPRSKPEDVCNVVRGGILENIKFIESKHICFITFIEPSAAVQFYANTFIDPIILHGNTLKIGWGNYSGPLSKSVALAVTVGASRNVYVSLPDIAFKDKYINDPEYEIYHEKYSLPSEEQLRKDFSSYGSIEQINYLGDSHCCWVNFMNITSAIKLVEDATNKSEQFSETFNHRYDGLIINYGKDRCGNINKNLASKNAKFSKKMKRHSRNKKLNRLEEKRKNQENNKKSFVQLTDRNAVHSDITIGGADQKENDKNVNLRKFMPLDSLGITIDTNNNNISNEETTEMDKKFSSSEFCDTESNILDVEDKFDLENSDISSDSGILTDGNHSLNTNGDELEKDTNYGDKIGLCISSKKSGNDISTLSSTPYQEQKETSNSTQRTNGIDKSSKNDNISKHGRIIPGSDVMAQYLAQLQHSTFIYAANVLGASREQSDPYSQDE